MVWAIKAGAKPGIYHSWSEVKGHIVGVPAVLYKKFKTEEEAIQWLSTNGSTTSTQVSRNN